MHYRNSWRGDIEEVEQRESDARLKAGLSAPEPKVNDLMDRLVTASHTKQPDRPDDA